MQIFNYKKINPVPSLPRVKPCRKILIIHSSLWQKPRGILEWCWIKYFTAGFIIFSLVMPLFAIQAEMRSSSYIIQETLEYEFDGPVITSITNDPGSTTAVITWTTDVVADGYVVYDTNSDFSASKEQGASAKSSTSHSVTVTGISASTLYYFKVKSSGLNNGTTTSGSDSFTTDAAPVEEDDTPVSTGGGGILIIDKTDKIAPNIINIEIENITAESITINWETNEEATSFIEYGQNETYGNTYGQWEQVLEHQVKLNNLFPETTYHFRVLSNDADGNLGMSTDNEATTISYLEEEQAIVDEETFEEQSLLERFRILEAMANLLPQALILGSPNVEVWPDRAIVSWESDKETNTLVAIAPESIYDPDREEPYQQIIGNPDEYTLNHRVEIFGLEANTTYNYQVRMRPIIGTTYRSDNFTFRTTDEGLIIDNYYINIADDGTISFKWTTNKEADSAIRFIPWRGDVLAVEESKTIKDNTLSVIHDIATKDLSPGLFYNIELISTDELGNAVIEIIERFSTGEDNDSPELIQIQTNSTIFVDKKDRVQVIVSWRTNEPATSKVYFLEGVHRTSEEWPNVLKVDNNYTKKHVIVINNFKSGTIYSLRIESSDSAGNTSISNVHTLITPKKKESIFDIIIRIFEEVFGWMFGLG